MNCPHCGKEINPGVNGETPVAPIYVNLSNNNGCNPAPAVTVIPNVAGANVFNPWGQPWTNTVCAAPAGQSLLTTLIKF